MGNFTMILFYFYFFFYIKILNQTKNNTGTQNVELKQNS